MFLITKSQTIVVLKHQIIEPELILADVSLVSIGNEELFKLFKCLELEEGWCTKPMGTWRILTTKGEPASNLSGFHTNLLLLKEHDK